MSKSIIDIPKLDKVYALINNQFYQVRFSSLRLMSNNNSNRDTIYVWGKLEVAGIGEMSLPDFCKRYGNPILFETPKLRNNQYPSYDSINFHVSMSSSSLGCFDAVFKKIKKHFPTADSRYNICWSTHTVLLRAYKWDGVKPVCKLLDWEYDVLNDTLVTSISDGDFVTEEECEKANKPTVHTFDDDTPKKFRVNLYYQTMYQVEVEATNEKEAVLKATQMSEDDDNKFFNQEILDSLDCTGHDVTKM